ncbi:hypothetical protein D908_00379 [Vibrio mimicus CAIM 602]|nr:hypothetical protein D908_00379 [Vibrio mimicus CAIM 602]
MANATAKMESDDQNTDLNTSSFDIFSLGFITNIESTNLQHGIATTLLEASDNASSLYHTEKSKTKGLDYAAA